MNKLVSGDCPHDLLRIVRRVIAALVAMALLNVAMMAAVSSPGSEPSMGTVSVLGTVKIDGRTAISGQTFFSGSNIVTSAGSESLIEFRNSAQLKLEPEADLTLDSSNQVLSGLLRKGQVLGSLPAGVSLDIRTADGSISTDGTKPVIFRIQTQECEGTSLSVNEGTVRVRTGDNLRILKAGEDFSMFPNAGTAPQAQQNLSHRKRVGLFIGIAAAVGVVLAVVLATRHNDCVTTSSPTGATGQCS